MQVGSSTIYGSSLFEAGMIAAGMIAAGMIAGWFQTSHRQRASSRGKVAAVCCYQQHI
jgi:hypothetical protein